MTASVPSGFGHLLHPQPPPPQPPLETNSNIRSRLRLFVRQEPIAARACGFGNKSRRPIDPLPVIQLLMTDFSPHSEEDMKQLTNAQHVVVCHLFPAGQAHGANPEPRIRSQSNVGCSLKRSEIGAVNSDVGSNPTNRQRGKILSGSTCASPFLVGVDPDLANAPEHPRSAASRAQSSGATLMRPPGILPSSDAPRDVPAIFFIFSDLCVRTAGWYRLRFRLVDVQETEKLGIAPCLHEVWSQSFQVFAAKDFPGMRPTPYLAMRLKDLGAIGIKMREKERGSRQKRTVQSSSEDNVDPVYG
ncbi:hypothetical protein EMPG_16284 [Blastomyces silverae]|uniref:Velvet domain-containing protein n=1 Tax=Blastomyces silverae TaxID=2060906 RepID=A0A0H1B9Y4_9EURO|nr:hypothetical protein EMPG_16284 [Blastomyces silverae]